MKKIVSMALALCMMLSLSVVTFAAEGYTDVSEVKIKVNYVLSGEGESPAETFTLQQIGEGTVTQSEADSAPALGTITGAAFQAGDATEEGTQREVTIALPEYERVGIYTYALKQVEGNTAGVTYYNGDIKMVVTVIEQDGLVRVAAVHTEMEGEEKSDTIENTYSANKITLTKEVVGNLGDKNKYFTFTAELKSNNGYYSYPESYNVTGGSNEENPQKIDHGTSATFYLKDGDTITIENVPSGTTFAFSEDADGYTQISAENYSGITSGELINSKFVNEKQGAVDTGVLLDSMPFVLLLALAAAGLIVMVSRKRVK